jgi:hypothetical protein
MALATLATGAQAQANFILGSSLCGYVSGPQTGGSTDRIFLAKGDFEATCSAYWDNNTITNPLAGKSPFTLPVCGMEVNFYYKNGNWDFYKKGGDGTLLGTCYGYNGRSVGCFNGFGTCNVRTRFKCNRSGFGPGPC